MRNICLTFTLCIYYGSCQKPPGDKNNKWRLNEILIVHIDDFYNSFALTVEDADDRSKRFTSIVSLAMSIYASSNITDPEERVRDAIDQTREKLNRPADVISSIMRSRLDYFRTILDPPINDVKMTCRPETTQKDCETALNRYHVKNERKCPGYGNHIAFYEMVADKKNSGYREDFLDEFYETSKTGNDETAIQFFSEITLVKYPQLFEYISSVFNNLSTLSFPCNAVRLLN